MARTAGASGLKKASGGQAFLPVAKDRQECLSSCRYVIHGVLFSKLRGQGVGLGQVVADRQQPSLAFRLDNHIGAVDFDHHA